jgi:hypothetical protein
MASITAPWTTWGVQPPAAPPPPPPPAPAPVPYAAPPPQKRGGPPWPWILLGCGCLLVILVLVGVIWGGTYYYRTKVAPQITKVEQEFKQPSGETTTSGNEGSATAGGESTGEGEQPEPTTGTPGPSSAATPQPSREAALKAALEGHSDWVGKIVYVSDDLQRVKVWIGPPQSEFTAEVVMEWNASLNRYLLKEAHPVPGSEAPAGSSGPQPGKDKAVAKALSKCDAGWVAKVMSHNADWTRATIAVGPPGSEWVGEVDVKWNGQEYVVTSSRGE